MFKYFKLRRENQKLRETVNSQQIIIDKLLAEISRRDQKIIEQQKRMRFFGIEIGNEEDEAEKLDFPSTIKI